MSANTDLNARWVAEVINGKNLDVISELCHEDMVSHNVLPGMPNGAEGARVMFGSLFAAFPDMHGEVLDTVEDGDRLCVRSRVTGTHKGEFMGIPATGKSVDFERIDILRFADGKVAEQWGVADDMGMMGQLGLLPEQ